MKRWIAWVPAVLYMALIWTLSSMSRPPVDISGIAFKDKGAHFIAYGVLAILYLIALLRTLDPRWRAHPWKVVGIAIALSMLWGGLDELHQAFVPNRSPEWADLAADTLGATVAAFLFMKVTLLLRAPSQS